MSAIRLVPFPSVVVPVLAVLLAAAGASACGGGAADERTPPADVEASVAEAVEAETGATPAADATPCEILDDELLRGVFEVGAGVEISRSPSRRSPYPLCTATWPKPNAAEIEERMAAQMMERVQARMRGEEVEGPMLRSEVEVALTLLEPLPDAAAARRTFDTSMRRLSEGMTASRENVEVTFQADVEPVEGIGDAAMWAPSMRQLSVVAGRRMFHLAVDTGAEPADELENAKEVARGVLAEL